MSRDITIKVFLSPEEYLAFRAVCDHHGAAQSARIRALIKADIRAYAQSDMDAPEDESPDSVHKRDT